MIVARALAATLAIAAAHGCGPPCVDDRCSLSAPTPQTTRVDYTNPTSTGTVTTGSAAPAAGSAGSAAPPVVAAGSAAPPVVAAGSAAPPVVAAGSGSAAPTPAAGSGSAAKPADPTPMSSSWELWSSNQFRMYVISRSAVAASSKVSFDLVKAPTKTPFVITLEVLPPGGLPASEAVWNDCPENKIRCDSGGTKTHVTKKAGQVLIQAGINWAVTGVTDEGKGTLVTWTNNLSREVVQLRLLK